MFTLDESERFEFGRVQPSGRLWGLLHERVTV
jgi:hypothetical protein